MNRFRTTWLAYTGLGLSAVLLGLGCGFGGTSTNSKTSLADDDVTSIAGLIDLAQVTDAETVPRDVYATSLSPSALLYPSATPDELAAYSRGLAIFTAPRLGQTDGEGTYFNQRNCLGCHMAQVVARPATPASRARSEDAFLLFGDFNPGSGEFRPRGDALGPVFHKQQLDGFLRQPLLLPKSTLEPLILKQVNNPNYPSPLANLNPPLSAANPANGFVPLPGAPFVRVVGMRAAPPYIGRGLMEAIPDGEINGQADNQIPFPSPDPNAADRIRRFENRNSEAAAIVGGSPLIRLSRFGLRAAGPTLLQFMIGGSNGEIGLTSPFAPTDNISSPQPKPHPAQDLTAQDIRDLRSLVRLIAPPARATIVPGSAEERGAALFGFDPTQPRGFAVNRQLNCAGCHTPIMITGRSPADVGSAHLSNKRFFPFSDLLIHNLGAADADSVLPGQGRADPGLWRTPPLMGIGVIGPPFFHDARVLANQSLDSALDQAIDFHDNNGLDTDSEANASAKRYRALPDTGVNSKADLIAFLKTL